MKAEKSLLLDALFPRENPWTEAEQSLFDTICHSHYRASLDNECVSSTAVRCSKIGGAAMTAQFIAGLTTVGSRHAPVIEAREILFGTDDKEWLTMFNLGCAIPGFGNQFYRDKIDPSFQPAFDALPEATRSRLNFIAATIRERKGNDTIFPNAASITAAVAHHLNLPKGAELLIFLIGRGAGWLTI